MSLALQYEQELVDILQAHLNDVLISAELFAGNEKEEDVALKAGKNAKGAIFVSYAGREYGKPQGRVYYPEIFFHLILFSRDRSSHDGILEMLDKVIDLVYRNQYNLITDGAVPVKSEKGYFMAVLRVSKKKVYPESWTG